MKKFILVFAMIVSMSVVFGQATATLRLEMPATAPNVGENFYVGVWVDVLNWPTDQTIWSALFAWEFDPAVLTPVSTGPPFNRYFYNINQMFTDYGVTPLGNYPAPPGDLRIFFATGQLYGLDPSFYGGIPIRLFDLRFTYHGGAIAINWGTTAKLEPVNGEPNGGKLAKAMTEMYAPPPPAAGIPYELTLIPIGGSPCTPGLWTGAGDGTNWFDPLNWDCGEVPMNVDVTIPGGTKAIVTISGGVAVTANLMVGAGGGVTVAYDGGLTTNGTFTNDGNFVIETDGLNGYSGTYIDNGLIGGITGLGTFEFNREMLCTGTIGGATDFNWHYVAAPLDGFTTWSMFDYYVNAWSEPASMWNHIEGMAPNCIPGPNVPLGTLEAWSINYANDYTCNAINPGTGLTLEFMGGAGAMHTGLYTAPATFTPGAYQGWNMFGNPYPSGLDMSLIAFDPNMVPGAAYWDGCLGNYVYWTIGLGAYTMAPGLGFFTEWTAPGIFSVAGTERAHGADWFWKSEVSDLVTIQITGNEKSDITNIRFMDNAQVGFAKDGDFHKLFSTEVPQIYTTAGADMLAVNCLPETATVPMGMTSEVSESYTISAIETSDFQKVILEDLFNGSQTDLLVDSYTFEYNVGDVADRFVLHFAPLGTPELAANSINIWAADHKIYVQAPATTGDIVVYNMMGQEVVRTDIEAGLNVIPMNDANTYYIVKVIGSDITETGKVFIK